MPTYRTADEIRTRQAEMRAILAEQQQNATFAATVVRIAREHEALIDQLHAAADRAGISHDEADALLVDEIEAGPAD